MKKRIFIIVILLVLILGLIFIFKNIKNKEVENNIIGERKIRIENSMDNGTENVVYDVYDGETGEKIVTLDEREKDAAYMYSIDPDYDASPIYPKIENP